MSLNSFFFSRFNDPNLSDWDGVVEDTGCVVTAQNNRVYNGSWALMGAIDAPGKNAYIQKRFLARSQIYMNLALWVDPPQQPNERVFFLRVNDDVNFFIEKIDVPDLYRFGVSIKGVEYFSNTWDETVEEFFIYWRFLTIEVTSSKVIIDAVDYLNISFAYNEVIQEVSTGNLGSSIAGSVYVDDVNILGPPPVPPTEYSISYSSTPILVPIVIDGVSVESGTTIKVPADRIVTIAAPETVSE